MIAGVGCTLAAAAALTAGLSHGPGSGVLTNGGGLSYGGITTPLGIVADFPLQVENSGSVPVTLETATLVPLPGYPTPRLVHLGVLAEHDGLLTAGRGWPVWTGLSPSNAYRLRPLRGYVVLPWKTRERRHLGPLPDMIEYGVLGARVNTDYWVAGLRVTYRMGGSSHTQPLYEGGADCVGVVNLYQPVTVRSVYRKYCATIDPRANMELENIVPPG